MTKELKRNRIETMALVIGYAMSRLDKRYLAMRDLSTWQSAFSEASKSLSLKKNNFKNLRDEFDPYHNNPRSGWHKRSLRKNRQRIIDELQEISDEALIELVAEILGNQAEAVTEAIDSLATATGIAQNVAERLLTGKRAENYFLDNSERLIGVTQNKIIDLRDMACGYDFGVIDKPEWAIEIKGMKTRKGEILFTDREWREAGLRNQNYWLIVVGNLIAAPSAKVIVNPRSSLTANCRYRQIISVTWQSSIRI